MFGILVYWFNRYCLVLFFILGEGKCISVLELEVDVSSNIFVNEYRFSIL